MFNFLDEIAKLTGLPLEVLGGGYRIINFDGKAVYIEGIQNILRFNNEEVNLKLKKGAVKLIGQNLILQNIDVNSIVVTGKIMQVEVS